MQQETHTLSSRAFADYLIARFRVKPGLALCVALDQPEARNNQEALEAWVAEFLTAEEGGPTEGVTRRLEQVFSQILMETGLIDGMLESFSFPMQQAQHSWQGRGKTST